MIRSLAWRLTLPIILVGLLMMLLGFGAAVYVHSEYRERTAFIEMQIEGENILQTLAFTARDVRTTLGRFMLDADRANVDEALALEPVIRSNVEQAARYVQTPEGQALIEQLRRGTNIVFDRIRQMRDLPVPDLRSQIIDFNSNVVTPQLYEPALKYLDLKDERVRLALEQNKEFSEMLVMSMLILGLCGATAGILWGVAVARAVGRSLVQMSVPIKSAAGRLNEAVGPLTVQTHWRFDELPAVVDRMAEQIGDVIEQMRQTRRRAERSEQLAAAGQLAAGMAHELRNPLTSMKLLVQSAQLKSSAGEALGPRDLSILGEEIERLERVVATILDYARPPRMLRTAVDLTNVIGRTVELMVDRYRIRGIELAADLPKKPCIVHGDAGQLRQVWLNLLLNSLDASITGQTVTIRLRADAPGGDGYGGAHHLVEVVDEGSGLPKDLGGDIFEPFVTTKETGLGLGLAISRRIIDEHGGRIVAADQPNGGAVMRVYLPVEAPLSDDLNTNEPVAVGNGAA
jgi:two-component system, NtrC family, sensor histidine kinase HydH